MKDIEVHATAIISKRTKIEEGCRVGPHCRTEGKVELLNDVTLDSNVIIIGPARIGKGSYIGPNSIIGFLPEKSLKKMIHEGAPEEEMAQVIIGENVLLRSNDVIYSGVKIGDNVRFGHNVMIRENVQVGEDSLVGTATIVDGGVAIGRRVSIQTGVYICTNSVIEDSVFLGPRCVFTNDKYPMQKRTDLKGPTIKREASIGANATILPGVIIGEGAVVGSGSVVTSSVKQRIVVAGVPAKKLRDVPPDWHSLLRA